MTETIILMIYLCNSAHNRRFYKWKTKSKMKKKKIYCNANTNTDFIVLVFNIEVFQIKFS